MELVQTNSWRSGLLLVHQKIPTTLEASIAGCYIAIRVLAELPEEDRKNGRRQL